MDPILFVVPIVGLIALCVAFSLYKWISGNDEGTPRMKEIAGFISEGSMAFLQREYRVIGIFAAVMFVVLIFAIGLQSAIAFLVGAAFSLLAGYVGMRTATNSNVRTAAAARSGMPLALKIAFRGGAVMGLCVVGFGSLGIGLLLLIFGGIHGDLTYAVNILTGFGLGASSIALFGRVGGGIYTKAADVGADLVGKVEAGIPEDDPRNPAVIADNVGDNVGDVAGMGSDLFESYCGSIIAATILGAVVAAGSPGNPANPNVSLLNGIAFPLMIATIGILASIICIFMVGGKNSKNPASALNFGTYASSVLVLIATFVLGQVFFPGMAIGSQFQGLGAFGAVATGVIVGVAIGMFTERYTSADYRSVKGIAQQSETGPGTTIIDGFAVGLISTVGPLMFIAIGVLAAFFFAGLYGIALAAVGMLSTAGMVVAVDAYGPIADNAGGIAEMSELPPDVRNITDALDSVGNTTAAIGKGFAIGSAALTALALFASYSEIANAMNPDVTFVIDILDPSVVVGLLIGGTLPFLFGALTMRSVGKAAFEMIAEVRRQFREDKGIMAGTSKPDYARCVSISTAAALKEMVLPGVLAVVSPIAVGIILGLEALGGFLAGSVLTGVLMAITMANAGGAWDNAKKYIEQGNHGGKGSDAHKAAVVGDTVGDPFKDTSGPSMNILIKLMTIVAVVFLPLFGQFI